jgi:hypothetical protein
MAGLNMMVGVASALIGYQGQQEQYAAQKAAYKANFINAKQSAHDNYAHMQNRAVQEKAAAQQQIQEGNIEAIQGRATAAAAGAEGGVQGNSMNQLIASYYAKEGRFGATVDTNYQMTKDSIWANMDQVKNQTQSQINSMPRPIKPSFADAAIRIAASGLQAAQQFQSA